MIVLKNAWPKPALHFLLYTDIFSPRIYVIVTIIKQAKHKKTHVCAMRHIGDMILVSFSGIFRPKQWTMHDQLLIIGVEQHMVCCKF